jgi:hypothetical protein
VAKGAGANDENPDSAFLTSVGRRRFRSIVSQPVRLGASKRTPSVRREYRQGSTWGLKGASLVSNMRRHFKNSSDANAESTIVGGAIVKAQSEPPKTRRKAWSVARNRQA